MRWNKKIHFTGLEKRVHHSQIWGKHWTNNNLDNKYGSRLKHLHKFPEDFPQKDPMAWIYPVEALGEFRRWMDDIYVNTKFPNYLANKVNKGELPNVNVSALIQAIKPIKLN